MVVGLNSYLAVLRDIFWSSICLSYRDRAMCLANVQSMKGVVVQVPLDTMIFSSSF